MPTRAPDFFKKTMDLIQEAVVIHGTDTRILYANRSASKLLGLSKSELSTKDAFNEKWDLIDEKGELLKIEDYPINIALKTKKSFSNYVIGKKYSNKIIWLNVNTDIVSTDEKIDYIIITFSDISKFIKTNEELELYKKIFENAVTGITVADMTKDDQPLIKINPMFEHMTGFKTEDALGKNCRFLQGEDKKQKGIEEIREAIKNKQSCEVELKNYKKDGSMFYNLLSLTPLFDKDKSLKYYIGIQHDITKQKKLELKFRKLINSQDNIVILSNKKEIEFANDKFFKFFGYENLDSFKNEYNCICELFMPIDTYFHLGKVQDDETWVDAILKLDETKRVVSLLSKDLTVNAFSVGINKYDKESFIITLTNISQAMLEKLELLEKTTKDKLTGAFNREYFEESHKRIIHEYCEDNNRLAIALIDIDHFKAVNDTYGHDIGDEVLIKFVQTLQKFTRKDDILFRWGGEEFILVLKVSNKKTLEKILNHLRNIIEIQDFPSVGKITCSIGGSIYNDKHTIQQTIKKADEAAYEAKANGRNNVVIK